MMKLIEIKFLKTNIPIQLEQNLAKYQFQTTLCLKIGRFNL